MGFLATAWAWVVAHPAETGWAIFGTLTTVVTVYRLNEPKIRARAAKTVTKADDKLVWFLDGLVAVFEIAKLFVPHGIARSPRPAVQPVVQPKEDPDEKP